MTITVVEVKTKREYQIDVRRDGENSLICPVCKDDRKKKSAKSMTFNAIKGVGNCHHCQASFFEKGKQRNPKELIKREYTIPNWSNHTELSDAVVKWFNGRGISQKTLLELRVTEGEEYMPQVSAKRNCIHFNYFRDGEIVNIKHRDGAKNFKLVSGAELIFYNLDSIKNSTWAVITEGEIDTLSFREVDVMPVVSVPNGASKGSQKLEYLDNCWEQFEHLEKIYIATDNDEAGRSLRDELCRRLGKERCYIVDFGEFKDANEVLQKDPLSLPDYIKNAKEVPIEGIFRLDELYKGIIDLKEGRMKAACGISISQFNRLLTFDVGYVTLITGVPNHGKGEFLDQILVDLAFLHGWPFGIFSPENHPVSIHASKLLTKIVGQPLSRITPTEIAQFTKEYNETFFFIVPPEDLTLTSILESAALLVKKFGIKGLVIDPWNKLDHQYTDSETKYISRALDDIDTFARKYDVHVFVVAHPTKMQKDRETGLVEVPTPYSVSGSAHWFNKPANCITVYRRFFDDKTSKTEIHVQKVKFKWWGEQGEVQLEYDYESGRYYFVGFRNTNSLLSIPQSEMPFTPPQSATMKPNLDFTVPLKDQQQEEDPINPSDEAPF